MNKKTICLYLQTHLPAYLKNYNFFDMGVSHQYFDTYAIKDALTKMGERSFLPTNKQLLDLIKQHHGNFKVTISLTGELIEQMEQHAPYLLNSFKELAHTGCVEFLCETHSHSLAFLRDEKEFEEQVKMHSKLIKKHFNQTPKALRLTGLIYSNQIGDMAYKMGYKTMLTENARHIMAWKSPNYVYNSIDNPNLKLLLRNSFISDQITFNFSNQEAEHWPITGEKVVNWLSDMDEKEELANIFIDYMALGMRHDVHSGIFEFLRHVPDQILETGKYEFLTVSETAKKHKATDVIDVPYPISWYEEECDLSVWLGNDMQKDAFDSLCSLSNRIRFIKNEEITRDWRKLHDSDHYYFMCTRWQADRLGKRFKNPYKSPYDAYINYMNVLSDLIIRIDKEITEKIEGLMKNKDFTDQSFKALCINSDPIQYTPKQIDIIIEIANTLKL